MTENWHEIERDLDDKELKLEGLDAWMASHAAFDDYLVGKERGDPPSESPLE